jgi:hypothetical protein
MFTLGQNFKDFILSEDFHFSLNEAADWNSNKFQTKQQRVNSGKRIEASILDALRAYGWNVEGATRQNDMFDKIDGFWNDNGRKVPLQVKYRDKASGNDIFMEVKKDYLKNIPGRDMNGKAELYVTLSNNRSMIMIRKADEAKSIALYMAEELEKDRQTNPNTSRKVTRYGMIMINPDPATHVLKLKAYIKPEAFSWKNDIPVLTTI